MPDPSVWAAAPEGSCTGLTQDDDLVHDLRRLAEAVTPPVPDSQTVEIRGPIA